MQGDAYLGSNEWESRNVPSINFRSANLDEVGHLVKLNVSAPFQLRSRIKDMEFIPHRGEKGGGERNKEREFLCDLRGERHTIKVKVIEFYEMVSGKAY